MTLAALWAIDGSGLAILIVGFDATEDAQSFVRFCKIAAIVAQQPQLMGSLAVAAAAKVLAGEPLEKSIPIALSLVKK